MSKADETKVVRQFGKKLPWLAEAVQSAEVASDLNVEDISTSVGLNNRCSICKAGKMLCGKRLKIKPMYNQSVVKGASPPSLFVGQYGYPYVYAGPLVPPEQGDTSLLDVPEFWFGKSMEEIMDMRFRLVRGKHRINVTKPKSGGKILDDTRLLGLAERSVDVDLSLKSKPDY
ncbi:MAG: hypothetical protein ACTSP5_05665 [Candidatus Heimdallarchaeota archaeon]